MHIHRHRNSKKLTFLKLPWQSYRLPTKTLSFLVILMKIHMTWPVTCRAPIVSIMHAPNANFLMLWKLLDWRQLVTFPPTIPRMEGLHLSIFSLPIDRRRYLLMFNQISNGMSKHDKIFGSYACNKWLLAEKQRFTRNYRKINTEINSVAWSPVYSSTNVDVKIDYFNYVLLPLLKHHAPLLPFKKKLLCPRLKRTLYTLLAKTVSFLGCITASFVTPLLHW